MGLDSLIYANKNDEQEVVYLRKCNQIHNWFCNHGYDDSEEYHGPATFTRKQIKKLIATINKVLLDNSLALELLPPVAGFFFGSTSIDDCYFEQLKDTKEKLKDMIKQYDQTEFYYRASW